MTMECFIEKKKYIEHFVNPLVPVSTFMADKVSMMTL